MEEASRREAPLGSSAFTQNDCVLPRLEDHLAELRISLEVRTVYTDLDGTLLGRGGSLFAGPEGITREPATAVAALAEAGVDLVLVSGRTRDQVRDAARIVGATAYIPEVGSLIVYREGSAERVIRPTGVTRGRGTAYQAIERSGAAGFLLEAYPDRLEPHAPWAFLERECSVLLRGFVDLQEARMRLGAAGYGWLDLLDNGIIPEGTARFPSLDVTEVHAYHLLPRGVSKGAAVALDRERRGLDKANCIAVGDSPSDVDMAEHVGAMFLVANAGAVTREVSAPANVYVTARPNGLGFADAVLPFVSNRASRG